MSSITHNERKAGETSPTTTVEKARALLPVNPVALQSSMRELEHWLESGQTLSEVENEVSFSESIALVLHELNRVRAIDLAKREAV